MAELKPCPFCGSDSIGIYDLESFTEVSCEICSARKVATVYEEAIKAWNTRALDERVKEFAREIIELAHEGDVDSGQIYEVGTRTGVMRVEYKTVPCVPCDETSEFCCACAEHADHGEVVDCYRLNPELFPAELKEKLKESQDGN